MATKEATWLCLLLTKLGDLQPDQQYAFIKVSQKTTCVQAIYQDLDIERGEEKLAGSLNKTAIVILLKGNNQGSITLAHNPVFYSETKYINI